MTMILGIDPGRKGALALLDSETGRVACTDMPETTAALHDFIAGLPIIHCAWLEQLHAGPVMGSKSVAAMFESYGVLKGALAWRSIPINTVRPSVWKQKLNCPADKGGAIRRAAEIFPDDAHQWPLKKHDGRAEAALIAWYGLGAK